MKKLKSIRIRHIKGIGDKTFELDAIPNRPSLLVAPNGFGKSSLAIAFASLNANRIKLDEDDFHNGADNNNPLIVLTYEDEHSNITTHTASTTQNEIAVAFDVQVIRTALTTKTTKRSINGFTVATSKIILNDICLISNIQPKVAFNYSPTNQKSAFGKNGKILPNIQVLLQNHRILCEISEKVDLNKAIGKKIADKLSAMCLKINAIDGTAEDIKAAISSQYLPEFESIPVLNDIKLILENYDCELATSLEKLLAAFQIISIYISDTAQFKKVLKYYSYLTEKDEYATLFSYLRETWQGIKPKEVKDRGLLIQFPDTHHISNGERDIIAFLAALCKAKKNLKKEKSILIIDEVFDYLDDANLIAAQYYTTKMIAEYKQQGKIIFPFILTHLNPRYFQTFCFKDKKVYYLAYRDVPTSTAIVKMLSKREEPSIKENVSKYHLHYHPDTINIRDDFRNLGLKETWGESVMFRTYCNEQLNIYLNATGEYDPMAVCCAVRLKVEECIYNKIQNEGQRLEYIGRHKTNSKLEYAVEIGIDVPEIFYMLGILYNGALHIHNQNDDVVTPVITKLENLTLKQMIRQIDNQ